MMCWISQERRIRWTAGLLLLAYGSAGVLGYGLHELWGCGHHCHAHVHADELVHSHSHGHGHGCHHHHHHEHHECTGHHESAEETPSLIATDDCAICQFLVQAQSPNVMTFETACLGDVLLIEPSFDSAYRDPFCGIASARAPPLG
jgi:hypothetical protein